MKKIHIKKPDLKGGLQKLKNLKKEDIVAHWKPAEKGAHGFLKQEETVLLRRRCSRYMHL